MNWKIGIVTNMKKMPVRIVLAIDNEIVRSSMKMFLETSASFQMVGDAADRFDVVSICDQDRPDLVLMDINKPTDNAVETIRNIRKQFPKIYILVFSSTGSNSFQAILDAGANSYLTKITSIEDLEKKILNVVDGNGNNPLIITECN